MREARVSPSGCALRQAGQKELGVRKGRAPRSSRWTENRHTPIPERVPPFAPHDLVERSAFQSRLETASFVGKPAKRRHTIVLTDLGSFDRVAHDPNGLVVHG